MHGELTKNQLNELVSKLPKEAQHVFAYHPYHLRHKHPFDYAKSGIWSKFNCNVDPNKSDIIVINDGHHIHKVAFLTLCRQSANDRTWYDVRVVTNQTSPDLVTTDPEAGARLEKLKDYLFGILEERLNGMEENVGKLSFHLHAVANI